MLSEPIAKPKRKSKWCPYNGMLYTWSRLEIDLFLVLNLKNACGSNTSAKCSRGVHFYYCFRMNFDVKQFGGLRAIRDRFCVLVLRLFVFRPTSQ